MSAAETILSPEAVTGAHGSSLQGRVLQPFYRDAQTEIFNADCMDVMTTLDGESVDMILCDLPYGTMLLKWDNRLNLKSLWAEYLRLIKPSGAIVLTAQQPFATELINVGRKQFRYEIIWQKTCPGGFMQAKIMPLRAHENILVFSKRPAKYNPQMMAARPYKTKGGTKSDAYVCRTTAHVNHGTRYPQSVIVLPNREGKRYHPTQKPVELMQYLILTYTDAGDVVLDNTMGVGTTLVAAKQLGRRSIGIEIEAQFCEVAKARLSQGALGLENNAISKPHEI
jgi:site-specific DNA-methyltransferase (adenine-specific)